MVTSQDVRQISLASIEGEAALKLRKRFWVDEFNWKEGDGSELESDSFDDYSGHFGFLDGNLLAGYCRFVPNLGTLPLAGVFPKIQPVLDELGDTCGEYSRLIISPEYRGSDLSLSFYRAVFRWAYPQGYTWWIFEVEQWMIDTFRALHFQVEVLDEPVFYTGANGHPDQWTFPVLLDIHKSLSELEVADPDLLQFFTDES